MANPKLTVELTGHLELELDGQEAVLEAKGDHVHLTFSSFAALRKYQRFFNQGIKRLSPKHPLAKLIEQFNFSFQIAGYEVGQRGPHIKENWWAKFIGLKKVQLNTSQLFRAWMGQFFKKRK